MIYQHHVKVILFILIQDRIQIEGMEYSYNSYFHWIHSILDMILFFHSMKKNTMALSILTCILSPVMRCYLQILLHLENAFRIHIRDTSGMNQDHQIHHRVAYYIFDAFDPYNNMHNSEPK